MQSIPFTDTIRDVHGRVGPQVSEKREVETGGCDAIHVIVAVKTDAFPRGHRPMESFDRLLHVRKQKRIVERGVMRGQPGASLFHRAYPAGEQNRRRHRRNGERAGERRLLLPIHLSEDPPLLDHLASSANAGNPHNPLRFQEKY